MTDDLNTPHADSAVRKIAKLQPGQAYSESRFLPASEATPDAIRTARRELLQRLSPAVADARKLSFSTYRIHTVASHTREYDILVAAAVVCESSLPPL